MFLSVGKLGKMKLKTNTIKKIRRNLDHITCKYCGGKGRYAGNSECSTQKNLKEDAESFRKTKQVKYGNNPPGGGVEKNTLVNVEDE